MLAIHNARCYLATLCGSLKSNALWQQAAGLGVTLQDVKQTLDLRSRCGVPHLLFSLQRTLRW
jgi:hypothetical protein